MGNKSSRHNSVLNENSFQIPSLPNWIHSKSILQDTHLFDQYSSYKWHTFLPEHVPKELSERFWSESDNLSFKTPKSAFEHLFEEEKLSDLVLVIYSGVPENEIEGLTERNKEKESQYLVSKFPAHSLIISRHKYFNEILKKVELKEGSVIEVFFPEFTNQFEIFRSFTKFVYSSSSSPTSGLSPPASPSSSPISKSFSSQISPKQFSILSPTLKNILQTPPTPLVDYLSSLYYSSSHNIDFSFFVAKPSDSENESKQEFETVKVNRIVLTRLPYFRGFFLSGVGEGEKSHTQTIKEYQPQTIQLALKFLYCSSILDLSSQFIFDPSYQESENEKQDQEEEKNESHHCHHSQHRKGHHHHHHHVHYNNGQDGKSQSPLTHFIQSHLPHSSSPHTDSKKQKEDDESHNVSNREIKLKGNNSSSSVVIPSLQSFIQILFELVVVGDYFEDYELCSHSISILTHLINDHSVITIFAFAINVEEQFPKECESKRLLSSIFRFIYSHNLEEHIFHCEETIEHFERLGIEKILLLNYFQKYIKVFSRGVLMKRPQKTLNSNLYYSIPVLIWGSESSFVNLVRDGQLPTIHNSGSIFNFRIQTIQRPFVGQRFYPNLLKEIREKTESEMSSEEKEFYGKQVEIFVNKVSHLLVFDITNRSSFELVRDIAHKLYQLSYGCQPPEPQTLTNLQGGTSSTPSLQTSSTSSTTSSPSPTSSTPSLLTTSTASSMAIPLGGHKLSMVFVGCGIEKSFGDQTIDMKEAILLAQQFDSPYVEVAVMRDFKEDSYSSLNLNDAYVLLAREFLELNIEKKK